MIADALDAEYGRWHADGVAWKRFPLWPCVRCRLRKTRRPGRPSRAACRGPRSRRPRGRPSRRRRARAALSPGPARPRDSGGLKAPRPPDSRSLTAARACARAAIATSSSSVASTSCTFLRESASIRREYSIVGGGGGGARFLLFAASAAPRANDGAPDRSAETHVATRTMSVRRMIPLVRVCGRAARAQ